MTRVRRPALAALALTLAAAAAATSCGPTLTPGNADGKQAGSLLYTQSATSGSLTDNGNGSYTLTLNGVGSTLAITDRPQRQTQQIPTATFVADWSSGANSFASDPPNAVLEVLSGGQTLALPVVLTNPQAANGSVTYTATPLSNLPGFYSGNGAQTPVTPGPFGQAALFIDGGSPSTITVIVQTSDPSGQSFIEFDNAQILLGDGNDAIATEGSATVGPQFILFGSPQPSQVYAVQVTLSYTSSPITGAFTGAGNLQIVIADTSTELLNTATGNWSMPVSQ